MEAQSNVLIPRVAIKFCTQCKWNLRAAYYAQELLQTFSTTLGEVSLLPSSGGIFTITLYHQSEPESPITTSESTQRTSKEGESQGLPSEYNINSNPTSTTDSTSTPTSNKQTQIQIQETLIWDRTRDVGFPETKELKNRIRNIIDPKRDMGHIDRSLKKGQASTPTKSTSESTSTESAPTTAVVAEPITMPVTTPSSSTSDHTKERGETEMEMRASGGEGLNFGDNVPGMKNEERGEERKEETGKVECEDCQ